MLNYHKITSVSKQGFHVLPHCSHTCVLSVPNLQVMHAAGPLACNLYNPSPSDGVLPVDGICSSL